MQLNMRHVCAFSQNAYMLQILSFSFNIGIKVLDKGQGSTLRTARLPENVRRASRHEGYFFFSFFLSWFNKINCSTL